MKPLRILFLLAIISLHSPPCVAAAPGPAVHEGDTALAVVDLSRFEPLGPLEGTLLFKAAIHLMGDYYSGLVLIKQLSADSAIHVVFLSELGLNLMDLAYRDEEFEVVSVQEFLNRSSILKTLQNDFRTLLLDLSKIEKFSIKVMDDGNTEVLRFRHRSQRYAYSCDGDSGPGHIRRRKGLLRRVDFNLSGGTAESGPLEIGIGHRGVRLEINLTALKQLN